VLVVGGRGYLGRRVVRTLALCDGLDVVAGGRGTDPAIDLLRPDTFVGLDGFDLVINCADSVVAPPDAAAAHVLTHGGVWIETSADAATSQRLLALKAANPVGHVIVGAGLSPGLSTMLGRYVADLASPCTRVDLGVRMSPLSGAGRGSCRLAMARLDSVSPEPSDPSPLPIAYPDVGARDSIATESADTALVRRAAGVSDATSHIALRPASLRRALAAVQWLDERVGPLRSALRGLLHGALVVLRTVVLRPLGTPVQLTAIANAGAADETTRSLAFNDARDAHAMGIAAVVLLWQELEPPAPGIALSAGLFGLDEALLRLSRSGLPPPALVDPHRLSPPQEP